MADLQPEPAPIIQMRAAVARDAHDRTMRARLCFWMLAILVGMVTGLGFLLYFGIPGTEADEWLKGMLGVLIGGHGKSTYQCVDFYNQSSAGSKAKDKPQ